MVSNSLTRLTSRFVSSVRPLGAQVQSVFVRMLIVVVTRCTDIVVQLRCVNRCCVVPWISGLATLVWEFVAWVTLVGSG